MSNSSQCLKSSSSQNTEQQAVHPETLNNGLFFQSFFSRYIDPKGECKIDKTFQKNNKNSLCRKLLQRKSFTHEEWLKAEDHDKLLICIFRIRGKLAPNCYADRGLEVAKSNCNLWFQLSKVLRSKLARVVKPIKAAYDIVISNLSKRGIHNVYNPFGGRDYLTLYHHSQNDAYLKASFRSLTKKLVEVL